MQFKNRFTFFIILFFVSITTQAELKNWMFDIRYVGYAEGLSNERVFSIIQDEKDAIWIATKIGVDRYNGTVVKSYILQGSDNYGDMAGRRVYLLYDKEYGIWAYDNVGRIFRYSKDNDSFKQILYLGESIKDVILNNIFIDKKGNLWLGLNKGLYRRESNGVITPIVKDIYVNKIISDNRSIFVGSSTSIIKVDENGKKVETIHKGEDVQSMLYDKSSDIVWFGTFNSGIFSINMKSKEIYQLKSLYSDIKKPVRVLTEYDKNTIIAGIDGGGVFTIDKSRRVISLLMNTEEKRANIYLRGNGVYAVMKDRQENLWIGSYTGGVSIAIRLRYPISTLLHEKGNRNSLANNNVNDILQMESGVVWYATDSGISICNSKTNSWQHIINGTVAITLSHLGNEVWVGTYGDGVYIIDGEGNIKRHLTKEQNTLYTNYIFSIVNDMQGDIWLGGLDGALMRLEKGSMKMHRYEINWVQSIHPVDKENVAVATVNGFHIINRSTGEIKHLSTSQEYYNINASAYIVSMLFNSDATVWLATEGGGINLYDIKKGIMKIITTKEGLPSNDVYSLQKDYKGRLWASTGKGLAIIENDKVSSLNYIDEIDKEYNKSSFCLMDDGKFAYGTTNGVVMISPDAVTPTDYSAPLNFTDFTIEYNDEQQREVKEPLVREMLNRGVVELEYEENSFQIAFESINYRFQRDILYQYIFEGYEKSWSEPSASGFVKFTNITPGEYKFKIRSVRRSDGHIISQREIVIEISQPWWRSLWACVAYICISAWLVFIFLRFKNNQMQKRHDEDKIRFFVNTAHDIRTPVTLIMSPLDDLCKENSLPENVKYLINLAHNNTRKLHELITKLLDFERVDTFRQNLKLNSIDLNDMLAEEIAGFQSICDKKQLHLSLSLPESEVYIVSDKSMLSMLLDNLISNACKYTKTNGTVMVSLSVNNRKAIISVEDTGIGIPKREQKKIFNEVFRAENVGNTKEIGTGFGLLQVNRIVNMLNGEIKFESQENRGSKFTITFKRVDEKPDEKDRITIVQRESEEITHTLGKEGLIYHADRDTILVVEDNDALRYYLRKSFENEYVVVDAADGEEAVEYLKGNYPDIILSDVMMPGIQGDELCSMVKQNPETAGIPFVLLTAKSNHEAVVEGLKKGADDYIAKPFSSELLKLKIRTLLENRNRLRQFYMKSLLGEVDSFISSPKSEVNKEGNTMQEVELTQGDHNFLMCAKDIVINNIADTEFSINQLCLEMAMSRTLFYGRVKSLTGKAPQEFIRIIRLQRAAELLKSGKTVQEVADETGFINAKYFSSLFKKQYGVQPSRYN